MLRFSLPRFVGTGILILLAGCAGQTAPKIQPNAQPAPTVTGVANQVDGVAPNRAIGVVFSEPMNPATINANTFYIQGVAGAVSYDATSRIATLKPNKSLAPTTQYTAVVTTGAMSAAGAPMAQNYTFAFTTRATVDNSPVVVMSTTPSNGATCADVNTKIMATFSEGVDPSTIDGTSFYIGGVTGTVTYDAVNIIAIFTPSAPLQANTTYTGTLTAAIKDLAGNALRSPYVFSFMTGPCGGGGGGVDTGAAYLYVGDNNSLDAVHGYSVNSATATVAKIAGSPFIEGGAGADSLVVNKDFLYASATSNIPNSNPPFPGNTSTVVEYQADAATGILTQTGTLTLPSMGSYLSADPGMQDIYVIDGGPSVLMLKINADGTLTNTGEKIQLPGPVYRLAVSPNGQLVYALGYTSANANVEIIWEINRDTTSGALTYNRQVASGQSLQTLKFDTSGKFLLVGEKNNTIIVDSVSYSTGDLTPVPGSPFATPRSVSALYSSDFIRTFQIDPSGQFVYALSSSGPNFASEYVTVFSLSQATGALTPVQTFVTSPSVDPVSLVVGQSLVYVVNTGSGPSRPSNIEVLKKDPTTGMLSAGGTPLATQTPFQTAVLMQF